MVFFVITFKRSIDIIHEKQALNDRLKTIAVDNFHKLEFSTNWDVYIQQGKRWMVDIEEKGDSLFKPTISNINGTLMFMADSARLAKSDYKIRARISMPFLYSIKAASGSAIRLSNFTTDSIQIILNDGCTFESDANTLKRAWYKTNGNVEMKWVHPL